MNSQTVAIVANGSDELIPNLNSYKQEVDFWIGADRGAHTLQKNGLPLDYAVGDFDSVNETERETIKAHASQFELHPVEKDKTDLELALVKAFSMKPEIIFLFGVTGGRMDHELINIQLLHTITTQGIRGIIVDKYNYLELKLPGIYRVDHNPDYPNISFLPFSEKVEGLTLTGFHYPFKNGKITWGSTQCISNTLSQESGTFSYERGIILLVKSRDSKMN